MKVERKRKKIKPKVEVARDVKPWHKRVGAKFEKGDDLVIKTVEVLERLEGDANDAKLEYLEADVLSDVLMRAT